MAVATSAAPAVATAIVPSRLLWLVLVMVDGGFRLSVNAMMVMHTHTQALV